MKYALLAIIATLLIVSPCIAKKSIDDIIADDYKKAEDLRHNEEDFSAKHYLDSTELRLKLGKDVDTLSPSIGQLKKLKSLSLIDDAGPTNTLYQRRDVTVPLEVLNLPKLQTLRVYGFLNLRLPTGTKANQIHSHIKQVIATYWGNDSISFLANLPQLRQLILRQGCATNLPAGFDRLHNLRDLRIKEISTPDGEGYGSLDLGKSLCGFTRLERLELSVPLRSPLPRCLERLTRLKSVTMASCRRESLPDKTKIYFPVALASLPNLEELTLWQGGRIEMPKASHGLKKLRKLTVDKYPEYDMCAAFYPDDTKQTHNSDELNFGLDVDAVVDYPELQKIILNTEMIFKSSTIKKNHEPVQDGISRFMGIIDAAWKNGKLPNLKQIDMWDRDDGDMNTITVWRRPSSRDESGTRLPKHDVNWMTQKEQEKAYSHK